MNNPKYLVKNQAPYQLLKLLQIREAKENKGEDPNFWYCKVAEVWMPSDMTFMKGDRTIWSRYPKKYWVRKDIEEILKMKEFEHLSSIAKL